jgi:hypothetical protein
MTSVVESVSELKLRTVAESVLGMKSATYLRELIQDEHSEPSCRKHPDHVRAAYPVKGWFKRGPHWKIKAVDLRRQLGGR